MSDSKCPACGAGFRESRAIGSNLRLVGTWFKCGALESRTDGKVELFTQSDLCRIRQRDALLVECAALLNRLGGDPAYELAAKIERLTP